MFVINALGQTSSNEPDVPDTTVGPTAEPTTKPLSFSMTDTQMTITSAPSGTSTIPTEPSTTTPVSSAAPPSGGGATCVQRCLAQSASSVGCQSGADLPCVCNSQTYLSLARTCFTNSGCNEDASQAAVQDYGIACSATTTPSGSSISTRSTQPTSRTRTNNPSLTSLTTQTLAFTSGEVVSISRGLSSTVTSGFTTVRTGQAGDFATDGGLLPTSGPGAGSNNNGALGMKGGYVASVGMMMGLGVIGGVAVLVL
ncbi:hypothetical protein OPQ81_011006 [Rhizoctonia solani]|nr:hypothetical protein OPQ81_011006 [Rhizoctonia solani]